MKTGTLLFVFIVHCLVLSERTNGAIQLSAKIPENAAIGEQVIRVQTTTLGAKEEVLCNITDGNIHGRFRVNHCVIEVARPLDFAVKGRYNLTVKVVGAFEICHVDVDVEDVEGYPRIYNGTCDILNNHRKQGHPAFNVDATSEFMGKTGGIIAHRFNTKNVRRTRRPYSTVQGYNNNDCLVEVMFAAHHPQDVRTLNGLWITQSSKTQHFFCELPKDGLSLLVSRDNNDLDEVLVTHVELELQPVGCPPNKYGLTCDQNCTCENGARCHALSGACKCQPGWQGVVCDIPHSTVAIIAILRRGIRLQKPPECPRKLYDVMMSCWWEEPSARPTPEELEQRLTECRHDPLFVVERETTL